MTMSLLPRFPANSAIYKHHCKACGQRIYWATICGFTQVLPVNSRTLGDSHFRVLSHAASVEKAPQCEPL